MKNFYHYFIFLIFIIALNSCTSKISSNIKTWYDQLQKGQKIIVIQSEQGKPKGVEILGSSSIKAYGYLLACSDQEIIEQAKEKARYIGGNCINVIWKLIQNNPMNTCQHVKFEILRLNNHQWHNIAKEYLIKE